MNTAAAIANTLTTENPRKDWLDKRRTGIGGSDIGAILGVNKYKTPVDVFLDKTGAIPHDDQMSEAAYWGVTLESVVATEYHRRTGNRVQRINSVLRDPERPWMLANIDRAVVADGTRARLDKSGRLVGIKGVLECKTASAYTAEQWQETDAPLAYTAQCQWYMAITGAEWCDLAVLIGGQKYECLRINRDDTLIGAITAEAERFWLDHVLARVPPTALTSKEATTLFPDQHADQLVTATLDDLANVRALRDITHQAAMLDDEADRLKALIQQRIGDAAGLADTDGSVLVTWKQAKPGSRTDWKQAAADLKSWAIQIGHPEYLDAIAEAINTNTIETAGSRRFLLKD